MLLGDVVHQRNGIRFVWDRGKADLNLRKHGVSFETACESFFDPLVRLLRSEARPVTPKERADCED